MMCQTVLLKRSLLALCGVFFSMLLLSGCISNPTPPVKSSSLERKTIQAAKPSKPKTEPIEKVCGVELCEPRQKLAQKYYVKGERLFGDDDVAGAKAALKTAVCLDAKHKQASELLQLLEKTYSNR